MATELRDGDLIIENSEVHCVMWVGGVKPLAHASTVGVIQASDDYFRNKARPFRLSSHTVWRLREDPKGIGATAARVASDWAVIKDEQKSPKTPFTKERWLFQHTDAIEKSNLKKEEKQGQMQDLSKQWKDQAMTWDVQSIYIEDICGGVLQRDVEVLGDGVVAGDGFEQARGDLVGIGVEEAQPFEAGERREGFEESGEVGASEGGGGIGTLDPAHVAMRLRHERATRESLCAEVFAVAGGVLADEGDLAHALGDEVFGLGDDGLQAARTELAAQLGDDAEAAGVVAAFGDLDVGRGASGGEDARGLVGVEIFGQRGGGAGPCGAGEAAASPRPLRDGRWLSSRG